MINLLRPETFMNIHFFMKCTDKLKILLTIMNNKLGILYLKANTPKFNLCSRHHFPLHLMHLDLILFSI